MKTKNEQPNSEQVLLEIIVSAQERRKLFESTMRYEFIEGNEIWEKYWDNLYKQELTIAVEYNQELEEIMGLICNREKEVGIQKGKNEIRYKVKNALGIVR